MANSRLQAVGERMALAARAVSYGANIAYTGPVATGFAVSPASIVVSFAGGVRPFAFQTIAQTASKTEQGFEARQLRHRFGPLGGDVM